MSGTPIRLLLVDDEEELVSYLEKRFTNQGFDVTGVTSGEAALAVAEEQVFDMAVVDLKMPGMDGLQVIHGLKELQPFLQAVVLTGHGTIDTAFKSGQEHAYRFLQKPFKFDRLVEILRQGHDLNRQQLRQQFQEELEQTVNRPGASAHEILEQTRKLRERYRQ
jgi:DNA-binding NtrC family response regulator